MRVSSGVSVALLDLDHTGYASEDPAGLTDEEVRAAGHISDQVERQRFLATRRHVRMLLGEVLECAPGQVAIRRGRNGKPEVADLPLHFGVASRGACLAVAVSDVHPVGVELAPVRDDPPITALMTVLPARVRFDVLNAAPDARAREFALGWCRIRAAVKACGAGLDEAERCLDAAPQDAHLMGTGLAIAVASPAVGRARVRWAEPVSFQVAS